jgi:serine/threonine protein kinase
VHLGAYLGSDGEVHTVALKRLHRHLVDEPGCIAMLRDEARFAPFVESPFVVMPFEVIASNRDHVVAMRYVHGASLARLLGEARACGECPKAEVACAIAVNVLRGLHAVHSACDETGPLLLVHRDVSPPNVVVGTDGLARLVDFGICFPKVEEEPIPSQWIKGKVDYMAPEHLRGDALSCASDVYALGVILWEMLTGARLFEARTERALFQRVLGVAFEPPSWRAPVSRALDVIVARALAHAPSMRFASAEAMASAIEAAGPLATPAEVAEWVERLDGERLAMRARRAAQLGRAVLGAKSPRGRACAVLKMN